jgi:biotin carboxyl carrier protein
MLKAIVNGKLFEVSQQNDDILVDGTVLDWDIVKVSPTSFHILYRNKSYSAELVKHDLVTKTMTVKINGQAHTVEVKDRYDLLLEKMGMSSSALGKVNSVKAPMPGLIVQVNIASGDTVKSGDPLLVLEAMKMENMIKASGDAQVKEVKVKKGDSVEKGQILIEFQS